MRKLFFFFFFLIRTDPVASFYSKQEYIQMPLFHAWGQKPHLEPISELYGQTTPDRPSLTLQRSSIHCVANLIHICYTEQMETETKTMVFDTCLN